MEFEYAYLSDRRNMQIREMKIYNKFRWSFYDDIKFEVVKSKDEKYVLFEMMVAPLYARDFEVTSINFVFIYGDNYKVIEIPKGNWISKKDFDNDVITIYKTYKIEEMNDMDLNKNILASALSLYNQNCYNSDTIVKNRIFYGNELIVEEF